jgi:NADPH:quinone reductase-like Zn-dependent oxidoreductase
MRAFVINKYTHPKDLSLTLDAPEPRPEPSNGEVLIDVYSAGLNFFDVSISIHLLVPPVATYISSLDLTSTGQVSKPTTLSICLGNGVGWQDRRYFADT